MFDTASYVGAKSGLLRMTGALASRLVKDNISVNAIAPGAFSYKVLASMPDRVEEAILAITPMRRGGE